LHWMDCCDRSIRSTTGWNAARWLERSVLAHRMIHCLVFIVQLVCHFLYG
jgi:hypothetical protein